MSKTGISRSNQHSDQTGSGGLTDRDIGVIGDPNDPDGLAAVKNSPPAPDEYGLVTRPVLPLTAFGEVSIAENTPQVQIKFPHGVLPDLIQSLTNGSGSAITTSEGTATITIGGGAGRFSQIRSLDVVRYGPGQGARFKFTAGFSEGLADSSLFAGAGDDDEYLGVGYRNGVFGVRHAKWGELEVRQLQVTGAADAGGGDFVLTLDGDSTTISVGAAATIPEIVAAIVADATNIKELGRGWEVITGNADIVEFVSFVAEAAAGTFSVVDTDSGVTFGVFTQATTVVLGASSSEHFVSQANWDDPCDGTGPSGLILGAGLDSSLANTQALESLNVWDIPLQFLGGGNIAFRVEDKETGLCPVVHTMKHAGALGGTGVATFRNTTFNMTCIGKTDMGFSGAAQTIKTGSMSGFIEGRVSEAGLRHSATSTVQVSTTARSIMLLHNDIKFQGTRNKVFTYPDFLTIASEAGKIVTVTLILNPTEVAGAVNYSNVDAANSTMLFDNAGTTVTGGERRLPFTLSGAESKDFSVKELGLFLRPTDVWCFEAVLSSGNAANVTIGLSWLERV